MDDARNLQYGIGFDTADAETSVENLGRERPSASPGLSVMLRVGWMIWLPVHPKQAMRPKRRRVIGT